MADARAPDLDRIVSFATNNDPAHSVAAIRLRVMRHAKVGIALACRICLNNAVCSN
jgi:hypothetical protein